MDNLTHSLLAVVLAEAGVSRCLDWNPSHVKARSGEALAGSGPAAAPAVTSLLILASNAPDVDVVSAFFGSMTYLEHHRGYTHTYWGVLLLALLLPLPFLRLKRIAGSQAMSQPARYGRLALVALVGTSSHLFLDFTNAYGIRPERPWNQRWLYGDFIPIIDPWIYLVLGSATLLILVRRRSDLHRGARVVAITSLILLSGYYVVCWQLHGMALGKIPGASAPAPDGGRPVTEATAWPLVGNPFAWTYIVDEGYRYRTGVLRLTGAGGEIHQERTIDKNLQGVPFQHAMETCRGKILLRFARHPFLYVQSDAAGPVIVLGDLRFATTFGPTWFASARIGFDFDWRERSENRPRCPWSEAFD